MIGDQILESFVSTFAKEHELDGLTPNKLFEHFANYAVLSRLYSGTVQLDALETDGAFGIDGVAVIANDVLVTSRDEVKDVARLSLDASFVFVQAKTSSSFDTGDILKFTQAVDDFFCVSPKIPPNERMKQLRDLRAAIFEHGIKMDVPPSCEMYFVYTGAWTNDAVVCNLIDAERKKLVATHGFSDVKFIPVDLEKLKGYFRSIKQRVVKQFLFEKKVVIPKVNGVNQAYIGVLSAKQYLKLITDPDGNLERGLFYENVRDYLGDNPVNREIAAAIRQSGEGQDKFVLLNNGVTIVARSITPVGDDFTLRDYQVVNGCQTSHVLFYNKNLLTDSLFLPIKLIATESNDLTNLVIKATNRQTEVKQEAFVALEPFQKRLEEFYASISAPGQKLYYERRSKQYEADDTPKLRVVSITMQTKCFVAMYLAEPHSTHRYYGELLNAYRKSIFQDDHDPQPYHCCSFAMFLIEREFRQGRLPFSLRPYRYHLLYLLRLYVSPTEAPSLQVNNKKTREFAERLHALLNDSTRFQSALAIARKAVESVLARSGTKYGGEAERRSEFTSAIRAEISKCGVQIPAKSPSRPITISTRFKSPAPTRIRGVIKRVGLEFGFITDENGEDVFFHRSQWKSPSQIVVGSKVTFLVTTVQKGLRAFSVRPERAFSNAPEESVVTAKP